MDNGFFLVLLVAVVAVVLMSGLQQWGYLRAVERMRAEHAGEQGCFLVSGRAKGVLRGAVVLLVVDASREEIIDALVMAGASVFARFKRRDALRGPLVSVEFRERDRAVLRAIGEARESFRALTAKSAKGRRPALRTAAEGRAA